MSDKREKIGAAMQQLVVEYGYNGASMSLLAKGAGVSTGIIYHYFTSKDAIIESVFTECKQRMGAALTRASGPGKHYKEQFCMYWQGLFHFFTKHAKDFRFIEYCDNSPYISVELRKKNRIYFKPVIDFMEDGITLGIIRDLNREFLLTFIYAGVAAAARLSLAGTVDFDEGLLVQATETSWKAIVN